MIDLLKKYNFIQTKKNLWVSQIGSCLLTVKQETIYINLIEDKKTIKKPFDLYEIQLYNNKFIDNYIMKLHEDDFNRDFIMELYNFIDKCERSEFFKKAKKDHFIQHPLD